MFHEKEKKAFVRELENGHLLHAYIIEGADGIGKSTFAEFASSAILCTGKNRPCGVCPSCKKIAGGVHPDMHIAESDGATVTVNAIRSIKKTLNILPNECDKKVYIIKDGEKMNTQAQNALLKFFEEPPESAVFFILTNARESLLATVISRGRIITLHPVEKEKITAWLSEKYPKKEKSELDSAAIISEGVPGKAEEMLEKRHAAIKSDVLEFAEILFTGTKFDLISYFKRKKYDRNKAKEFLSFLSSLIGDVIHAKQKVLSTSFTDFETSSRFAKNATEKHLMYIENEINTAYSRVDANGNLNLTLTCFAVRLSGLRS